ncbi:MAG: SDR family NAD(P)-dependent oxidoreductase [Pirellulaceae bacterium]
MKLTTQTNNRNSSGTATPEPLAIIGIGCRFPGAANSWQEFWNLLDSGTDAISETPEERWNLQKFYAPDETLPGKTQSKWGGYVSGIERFDPQLFGISPREAASMDPQQRMLLEVAYRAIEDAGQPTQKLAGNDVAVFVGISSFDYAVAGLSFQDRGVIDAYSNTGGSSSIAANRISYCFDLRGPSVAVDTACSSSLVAVHMACESIWRGDAQMALAGGVNALLLPDFYVAFSQLGVLSPDGKCKTFDASANGYVRSEGAGMVMLKPLSAALRDRDPIYSVVRATALNQDGRTQGMTVPSGEAQKSLIETACKKAKIQPGQVQYVEAHGTGTAVGDPIEANALGEVLGKPRKDSPCIVGSVKTNIGHLEAGAGIASLIKVSLALHHRRIPAHLNFQSGNPDIDFDALNLRVPTETEDWESAESRIAGVNGFGYGGANAHVILEEAPKPAATVFNRSQINAPKVSKGEPNAPVLLPLSARSPAAIGQFAGELADWMEQDSTHHIAEIAGYLAHRRAHFDTRTTVSAVDREGLVAELRSLAESPANEYAEKFNPSKVAAGPVFVCSGQGPQWWAMGRGLLKYSPAFRSIIKKCDAEFSKYGSWSLLEELTRSEAESRMQKTSIAQPSIFAIQVALAGVWESWGIRPSAIVGHSVGEIAAAYLSGALNWEDACKVAFHRGRTMDLASSEGAMLAAGLSPNEVLEAIAGIEDRVSVAAINGPTSVTISGERDAIHSLADKLESQGIFCRRLAVEYAFHSPQMEPVREELLRSLASIQPRETHTPLVSTVTGKPAKGTEFGAEYWWRNVRQAVQFSQAMHGLAESGYGIALEIGPHPVLAYSINECFQSAGESVRCIPSLNRQQDDLQCMSKSLGSLFALGFDIDWAGFYNRPSRVVPIPTYPFQLQDCWSESYESKSSKLGSVTHPLLGARASNPTPTWQSRIDLKLQSFLNDHQVRDGVIYPAAAMIDSSLAAADELRTEAQNADGQDTKEAINLERIQLHTPCTLTETRPQWLQSSYDIDRRDFQINFRQCEDEDWSGLASFRFSKEPPRGAAAIVADFEASQNAIRSRCETEFDTERLYNYCTAMGLRYHERFQGIVSGRRRDGESLIEVRCPESIQSQLGDHLFHPALLDACFHSMIAADPNFDHTIDGLYLPVEIERFSYFAPPTDKLHVHTRVLSKTKKYLICDLDIFNDQGELCVSIRKFHSLRVAGGITAETTQDLIYGYEWQPQPINQEEIVEAEPGVPNRTLIFMDEANTGRELVARLKSRGDRILEVYRAESHVAQTKEAFHQVDPEQASSFDEMLTRAEQQLDGLPNQVIYLWGLDTPTNEALTTENLRGSADYTSLALLNLVQAWSRLPAETKADFTLVTSGGQSVDRELEPVNVGQGPLIGFGRVIVSEYAQLDAKLVDLPREISSRDVDALIAELSARDDEDEIMWRGGSRFVHRFVSKATEAASQLAVDQLPCQLSIGESSGIEELHYATKSFSALKQGEIEIEVAAAGLNFSDVMKALDLYPGLPDGPVDLGAECSGVISRVPDGSPWNVGDEVIAIAPGAFATHVVVNEALVARKPANLSHEQASALPVAFLTAEYALNDCARLESGESVLIHSASGGVGLAAMQLAKLNDVRILATAGNDKKRQYVRDYGATFVMDSRSLAFADETMNATAGVGVDAVLNSLPGEAIAKGISTLKTGGRFLEIGKRDIYGDAPLGLYPFRNNLTFNAIDLDQLFKQKPERMGTMLRSLVERFESGELQPLPIQTYAADDTVSAFRFMQQGKHIGKVVLSYNRKPTEVRVGRHLPTEFHEDATYWIVGGLGGFGLEITKWFVERGARNLVLSGRNCNLRPEAQEALADFKTQGVNARVIPADITQAEDVRRVLSQIDTTLPPLKGVVHTAMVLEDKLLVDLDRETLERVLWPKVLGGWNLHAETTGYDLDLFVLFSSLSSVFGHAGQANYSAANACLDSLACYRRAIGLPATVMNWGHLGEVGYLAEREELGQRLERQGVLSFSVRQATDCLDYALQNKSLQLSVLRMNWSVWRGLGITNRVSPRFAHLLQQSDQGETSLGLDASADSLRGSDPVERANILERMLRSKAGMLLGIAAEEIPADRALLELGLDSLMAVEMRNWIEGKLEINLPISILMRSDNLPHLAAEINGILDDNSGHVSNPTSQPATDLASVSQSGNPDSGPSEQQDAADLSSNQAADLLEDLPNMDADEVNALLSQMLREQN